MRCLPVYTYWLKMWIRTLMIRLVLFWFVWGWYRWIESELLSSSLKFSMWFCFSSCTSQWNKRWVESLSRPSVSFLFLTNISALKMLPRSVLKYTQNNWLAQQIDTINENLPKLLSLKALLVWLGWSSTLWFIAWFRRRAFRKVAHSTKERFVLSDPVCVECNAFLPISRRH